MHYYFPGGLVLLFIAFGFFYYSSQKQRIRRELRRERLEERHAELMEVLRKQKEGKVKDNDAD